VSTAAFGATDPVQRILDRVEHVRSGAGWSAICPAHPDRHKSLSINRGDNYQALIFCHAGCEASDVMGALGLGSVLPLEGVPPAAEPAASKPPAQPPAGAEPPTAGKLALAQRAGGPRYAGSTASVTHGARRSPDRDAQLRSIVALRRLTPRLPSRPPPPRRGRRAHLPA